MPVGMIISYIRFACERRADVLCHIGVGFCVARLDDKGNAKASKIEMSNRYRLLRFFVICPCLGSLAEYQKLMTMKVIIAISAFANRGKTSAIVRLAELFPMNNVEYFSYTGERLGHADCDLVLCRSKVFIGGKEKLIGFSSEGDGRRMVERAFELLTDGYTKDIDLFVIACRGMQGSCSAVLEYARIYDYEMIWTANYRGADSMNANRPVLSNGMDLNDAFAKNTITLINQLLL